MGYADGYYYGQGKIICDTATFTAGDTIRVRSMTDVTKIWNKTVVTAGTPLIFDVPGKDYYKICTVQEISDVETEIGGVYKTIDYGQTLFINVLDKTTLGGIQSILNNHNEVNLLNIGDEVTIRVVDSGEPRSCTLQIAEINLYGSHEATFVAKNIWSLEVFNTAGQSGNYTSSPAELRTKMQAFYNGMSEEDKALLKLVTKYTSPDTVNSYSWTAYTDYVFPLNAYEIFGIDGNNTPTPIYQLPIFTTQEKRIKTYNGVATSWWSTDGTLGQYMAIQTVGTNGAKGQTGKTSPAGVVPCFRLTADS